MPASSPGVSASGGRHDAGIDIERDAAMSLRTAIPRDQLRREALLLSKLLQQHADDSLRSREGRTRFLHFIDAHELKTHLRADEPQFLHGFMLDAETAICSSAGRTSMENDVRLKSERILNWLLYEQPDPVVLLPPHAEEIDYEISYLRKEQLMRNLRLVAEAHRQLGAIKGSKMSHELMIKSAERAATGDPQSREELLRFLHQAAPAVAALLDSTRDVVSQRVEHLINHSNVVPLELLDWGALGVTGDLQLRCRALRPSESQIAHWRKVLAASRSNSSSANRVDAEAIAYLCALNQLFRDYKAGVHAVLVTRALTLMHTLNDPNRLYTAASASVRHTRLLWMPEHASDAPALPSGVRTQLSNTLQGLSLSLQNYQRQLGLDTAETVEHVTRDAESLVAAWRQFEGGASRWDWRARQTTCRRRRRSRSPQRMATSPTWSSRCGACSSGCEASRISKPSWSSACSGTCASSTATPTPSTPRRHRRCQRERGGSRAARGSRSTPSPRSSPARCCCHARRSARST
jgi:hypothetical protein